MSDRDIVAYVCDGEIFCPTHAAEMGIADQPDIAGPVFRAGSYCPVIYFDSTRTCGHYSEENGRCGELLKVALSLDGYKAILMQVAEHVATPCKSPNPELSEVWYAYKDDFDHMI